MSILFMACVLLVSLSCATVIAAIGGAAQTRSRAQLAADAAALAAVFESSPYGAADPEGRAREYARLNDARLTECDCVAGASEMEVEVVLDGFVARARAVIEVDKLAPAAIGLGPSVATTGLNPKLEKAVSRLVRASNERVYLVSGWRSVERQSRLWNEALAQYGDPEIADDWVARPGTSNHERGLAVDLGGDLDLAMTLIDELGLPLWRPMSWEPWHFELTGGSRG
ncbi:MAG: D-alanyl-D-alanine carboxypeptidase family protein [Actinomycetota bacterium]